LEILNGVGHHRSTRGCDFGQHCAKAGHCRAASPSLIAIRPLLRRLRRLLPSRSGTGTKPSFPMANANGNFR
jgi:hypothetical protein